MDLKVYSLFNSGHRNSMGIGFLFSNRGLDQRKFPLRIRDRFFNTTFIKIHEPMEEKKQWLKIHYENQERTYEAAHSQSDVKVWWQSISGGISMWRLDFNNRIVDRWKEFFENLLKGKDGNYECSIGIHQLYIDY